jgi:hypothetical protein
VRLASKPEEGPIIRGSSGIRKVRVAASSRGKRGGARVIYYWAVRKNVLLFLFVYAKNETSELTPKQIATLSKVVREEFGNESGNV